MPVVPIKQRERVYDFARAGLVGVTESIKFDVTAQLLAKNNDPDFCFATNLPPAWKESLEFKHDKSLKSTFVSGNKFSFHLAAPKPGEHTVQFQVDFITAPLPTATGIRLYFTPECEAQLPCKLRFEHLPLGTQISILGEANHTAKSTVQNKVDARRTFAFDTAQSKNAQLVKLDIPDAISRDAVKNYWQNRHLALESKTQFSISNDGTVNAKIELPAAQPNQDGRSLTLPAGPAKTQRYIIGATDIMYGYASSYSDEIDFHLAYNRNDYSYSLIDALTTDADGRQRLTLALPALVTGDGMKLLDSGSEAHLTYRKKITVELPPGIQVDAQLIQCLRPNGTECAFYEKVSAKTRQAGNILTLEPEIPQATSVWYLILNVTQGKFDTPTLWKEIQFSVWQYSVLGNYPRWVFFAGVTAIFLTLIFLIVFFVMRSRAKHVRRERKVNAERETAIVQSICKSDAAFDLDKFTTRARLIAERIQSAWSKGDMSTMRRFLSQGVYNRFRLQLKIMREIDKRQNVLADFKIRKFHAVVHKHSGAYDSLLVKLDAELRDATIHCDATPDEAHRAAKKAPLQSFVEYYTFMRRRDAKTTTQESIDACSRCGTPFAGEGEITKCKSCGAVMGSGTYDWVLAEITQESEYQGDRARRNLPQGLSYDRVEDRASFIFWRDLMARMTGSMAYIRRDAQDNYLKEQKEIAPLFDVAVGAVDLENLTTDTDGYSARVRIKWSAAAEPGLEPRHRESILTLGASADDATGGSFSDPGCETCGAPLPETDSEKCSYCQSPIQAKNKDWLLTGSATTVE